MCEVMKYLHVPKDQIVFDYKSKGDLFYMVISGKVSCKVPFYKQLMLLSRDEKRLYLTQFQNDIFSI